MVKKALKVKIFSSLKKPNEVVAIIRLESPDADIEITGPKAEFIAKRLSEGIFSFENGKLSGKLSINNPKDSVDILINLCRNITGGYFRASRPYLGR